MSAPRRLGVLTFHRCINYGSYWQARCLAEGLAARGFEVSLLDHRSATVDRAEWRCALQPTLPQPTPASDFPLYARKSRRFFDAFGDLPLSRPFNLDAPELPEPCDAVVIGSDEVWNFRHPWYAERPLFFGDGIGDARRISYAASFGAHDASAGLHPWWAGKLAGFSALAVRDENSRRLVRESLGLDPEVVLDPCLQFSGACRAEPHERWEGHAVIYGHSFADWFVRAVRRWAEARGIRLLSLGYRNAWADAEWIDAGPLDFARVMAGARAVITNFFHGCVFALVNGRPFASLLTAYRSHKISDLVHRLGAPNRLIDEVAAPARLESALDVPPGAETRTRIDALRRRSEAYLDLALA
jgi:hypothetical protein